LDGAIASCAIIRDSSFWAATVITLTLIVAAGGVIWWIIDPVAPPIKLP